MIMIRRSVIKLAVGGGFLVIMCLVLYYRWHSFSRMILKLRANLGPPKVVYGATPMWQAQLWKELMNFEGCEYSNCVSRNSTIYNSTNRSSTYYGRDITNYEGVEQASVLLFAMDYIKRFPLRPWTVRQNQHWIIMSYESSAYRFNEFKPQWDNQFNGSMTFRRDSTIYYPWGKVVKRPNDIPAQNYALNKTKGAFAYVGNCKAMNYKRLEAMQALSKYINVDIFGGCTGKKPPCPQLRKGGNPKCESRAHQPYRFFLSFENSLCRDYITEKFWDRLESSSYFLPIAMGGLSLQDYTSVAPENSFLHIYNFTSIDQLGRHLKYLVENDNAYNKYHTWRTTHYINTKRDIGACELCRLAHEKPHMPAIQNLSKWWNDKENCNDYAIRVS